MSIVLLFPQSGIVAKVHRINFPFFHFHFQNPFRILCPNNCPSGTDCTNWHSRPMVCISVAGIQAMTVPLQYRVPSCLSWAVTTKIPLVGWNKKFVFRSCHSVVHYWNYYISTLSFSQVTASHSKIAYSIFKWVTVTWGSWKGMQKVVHTRAARWHAPFRM